MATAIEGATAKRSMAAGLAEGVNVLDNFAEIVFQKYDRFVLPLDGFIFWIASSDNLTVKGSLHFSTQRQQKEDETVGYNNLILTSLSEVTDFNDINNNILYLATLPDGVQYSFSNKGMYFGPSDLYHYTGIALLPAIQSQLIQDPSVFDRENVIVSNSLPFWLSLNNYIPPYPGFVIPAGLTLYPSFSIPSNISPPYGSIHIDPERTESLQAAPIYDANLTPSTLTKDVVKITLYGLRNNDAQTFINTVLQYSFDYDYIGMMNMPIIRDDKRTQVELSALFMKKSITFEVTYQQTTMRNVARQMIENVINNYFPQPLTVIGFVPEAP